MADIVMCSSVGCIDKDKCYRHTAPMTEFWQSMFVKPPLNQDGTCDKFWDNHGKPKGKQVSEASSV